VTNPAPGPPPAPRPPNGQSWPQPAAPQQAAQQQPTALTAAVQQPHAPHAPAQHPADQQAQDDATIRLPLVQPGPQPQARSPHQAAFGQPAFAQGPQQGWPQGSGWAQGPGYQPGAPGQPGPYGPPPAPRSRKTGLIIGVVVAAVVMIGGLATGVVLIMNQASESDEILAAPGGVAAPPDSELPGSDLPGSGDVEPAVQELALSLRSSLNERDVDGLLLSVCEDGKVGDAARNDLVENFPFLNPDDLQHAHEVDFSEPEIVPSGEEYLFAFAGDDVETGEPLDIGFRVVTADGIAKWCGVIP
jgi:hypothetical protein